jgi:MoxR-like ATPase
VKGPVFTTFLADETQSRAAKTIIRLAAMQERQVTIDCDNHPLSPNFTVFATQNPIEYEGTYPLPKRQKDRF